MSAGGEMAGHPHFEGGLAVRGNRWRTGDWKKSGRVKAGRVTAGRAKAVKGTAGVGQCMWVCIESEVPQGSNLDSENLAPSLGCMDLNQIGTEVKVCQDFVVMQVIMVQVTVVVQTMLPPLPCPSSGRA